MKSGVLVFTVGGNRLWASGFGRDHVNLAIFHMLQKHPSEVVKFAMWCEVPPEEVVQTEGRWKVLKPAEGG